VCYAVRIYCSQESGETSHCDSRTGGELQPLITAHRSPVSRRALSLPRSFGGHLPLAAPHSQEKRRRGQPAEARHRLAVHFVCGPRAGARRNGDYRGPARGTAAHCAHCAAVEALAVRSSEHFTDDAGPDPALSRTNICRFLRLLEELTTKLSV
jgi:hypothetical protein